MFTTFDKAIVAFLVPVIIQLLIAVGYPNAGSDQTVSLVGDLLTGIITLLAVYFTPNKGTRYVDPTADGG